MQFSSNIYKRKKNIYRGFVLEGREFGREFGNGLDGVLIEFGNGFIGHFKNLLTNSQTKYKNQS